VYDPGLGAVVLFVQGVGVEQRELWAWKDGRFGKVGEGVFPGQPFGPDGVRALFACHDPVARQTLLFGALRTAVLVSTVDDPTTVRTLALPEGVDGEAPVFAGFRLGDRLLFVAGDGTVFAESTGATTLSVVGAPPPGLAADRPLCTAAADPDRGILVAGTDNGGELLVFDPAAGWTPGPATGNEGNSLVWNPVTRRIDLLGAEKPADLSPQRLRPWDDLTADGPRLGRFTRTAPLAFAEEYGEWVLLDHDHEVFTASPPADFAERATPGSFPDPTADWVLTATTTGPVWVQHTVWLHRFMRFDGERWVSPENYPLDLAIVAATPHGLAVIDEAGALHRIGTDDRVLRIAAAHEDLESLSHRYGHDRLCWDERAGELVLWRAGDHREQETWVHRRGRWSTLAELPSPPPGPSLLCPSRAGVYCLAAGQLWLLDGDRWRHVGDDPDWSAHLLFCPPRHGGLWSVSPDGVGVWRDGRFALVAELPPMMQLVEHNEKTVVFFDTRSRVVYDPVGDQLLGYGGAGTWQLDLGTCGVTAAALPGAGTTGSAPPRPAPEDTPASCYVLECSGTSDWRTLDLARTEIDLLDIRRLVEERVCVREDAEAEELGRALELIGGDFVWRLWTVRHGVLSHGVDLLPHLHVHFRDGTALAATEPNREAIWDREDDAVSVSLDWSAAAGAVPELPEPLLQPGDAVVLQIPRSNPGGLSSGSLGHGKVLRRAHPA
jgi:hypothetical protein